MLEAQVNGSFSISRRHNLAVVLEAQNLFGGHLLMVSFWTFSRPGEACFIIWLRLGGDDFIVSDRMVDL